MSDEEYERKVKGTKTFCLIIGTLFFLGIFINFSQDNTKNAILCVLFIILLCLFYSFTKKRKIIGPIIGIFLGAFYIFQFNIVSIIIGVCILIDCIPMFKYVKKINE